MKSFQNFTKITLLVIILSFFFVSESISQGWVSKTLPVNSTKHSIFFVNANTGIMVGAFPYIHRSTNGGDNWDNVNASLGGLSGTLYDVFFIDNNIGWAVGGRTNSGVTEGIVLKTTNGGLNWDLTVMVGVTKRYPTCVHFFNASDGVLASYSDPGLGQHDTAFYRSSDGGATWLGVAADTVTDIWAMSFPSQTNGFAVGGKTTLGQNYHNFYSTGNSGATWTYSSPNASGVLNSVFFPNTTTGYAVGRGQFSIAIKTTNSGTSWFDVPTGFPTHVYRDVFFTSPETGFVVGVNSGSSSTKVMRTTNGGTNWTDQTLPPGPNPYSIFFIDQNTGWICGTGNVILKTTDGGGTVGINMISSEVPSEYVLKQNYPNPFNPSTKIDFNISRLGVVNLQVYNSAGLLVSSLVNRELAPGSYSYDFDGSGLSSGLYFYRLTVNGFTETRKMLLVK